MSSTPEACKRVVHLARAIGQSKSWCEEYAPGIGLLTPGVAWTTCRKCLALSVKEPGLEADAARGAPPNILPGRSPDA